MSEIFDTKNLIPTISLPHDGFRLDSSVTQPLGSGTGAKRTESSATTVGNPRLPDAALAFRTKVTGGFDIAGFMALEDSKDGAWRTRTVEV